MKTIPCYCYWWKDKPNFGDALTPIILDRIFGVKAQYVDPFDRTPKLFGVGTIAHMANAGDTLWGSGMPWPAIMQQVRVDAVRGPLTARAIRDQGGYCPEIYGDPGLLIDRLYPKTEIRGCGIGIIPHWSEALYASVTFQGSGCDVISPLMSPCNFAFAVASCDIILSSSLHGLITADAYGIPSRFVRIAKRTEEDYRRTIQGQFKFDDYRLGVGLPVVKPKALYHPKDIASVAASARWDKPKFNAQQLIDAFPCNG